MSATFPVGIITTKSNPTGVSFKVTKEKGHAKYSLEKLKNKVREETER